jgi:hypothetical protein
MWAGRAAPWIEQPSVRRRQLLRAFAVKISLTRLHCLLGFSSRIHPHERTLCEIVGEFVRAEKGVVRVVVVACLFPSIIKLNLRQLEFVPVKCGAISIRWCTDRAHPRLAQVSFLFAAAPHLTTDITTPTPTPPRRRHPPFSAALLLHSSVVVRNRPTRTDSVRYADINTRLRLGHTILANIPFPRPQSLHCPVPVCSVCAITLDQTLSAYSFCSFGKFWSST